MEKLVVTRHKALVQYLLRCGLVLEGTPVLAHATAEDVRGKHVFGVLPLRLACLAAKVTEVPLDLPPELRGQELGLEQVEAYAGQARTYVVKEQVWSPTHLTP